MYSKSSRLFTPAFRGGASNSQVLGARPVQQVRRIVNRPLFDALQQSPWAPTLAQHYQFQGPGECVTNAEEMQARILYALHGQGRIEIVGRTDSGSRLLAKLQQRFGINKTPDLDREYRVNPTVDEIVDMVERFPPCVLILARMLPADEGGIQYPGHHAVLAVDTVEVEGQIWVVAVDGCDQKSGPIMARVRAYADKYHDGDLEKITNGDLSAIRMEMKQAGEPGDPHGPGLRDHDPGQVGVRTPSAGSPSAEGAYNSSGSIFTPRLEVASSGSELTIRASLLFSTSGKGLQFVVCMFVATQIELGKVIGGKSEYPPFLARSSR